MKSFIQLNVALISILVLRTFGKEIAPFYTCNISQQVRIIDSFTGISIAHVAKSEIVNIIALEKKNMKVSQSRAYYSFFATFKILKSGRCFFSSIYPNEIFISDYSWMNFLDPFWLSLYLWMVSMLLERRRWLCYSIICHAAFKFMGNCAGKRFVKTLESWREKFFQETDRFRWLVNMESMRLMSYTQSKFYCVSIRLNLFIFRVPEEHAYFHNPQNSRALHFWCFIFFPWISPTMSISMFFPFIVICAPGDDRTWSVDREHNNFPFIFISVFFHKWNVYKR